MTHAFRFLIVVLLAGFAASTGARAQTPSLEQMAGQMILVGFQGDSVDDAGVRAIRDDIAAGRVGGVMYLKTNVASLPNVRAMNAAFMAAAGPLPPFIAIDQEGGAVERLTSDVGFTEIPNAETVAAGGSVEAAYRTYLGMAEGLAANGFNMNFGPVVDLDLNPANPVIGRFGRSFSADPEVVSAYAEAFILAHHEAGVLTALKHFPGHGSSADDSHEGFTDVSETWSEVELEPYRALIGSGSADMVMAAHIYQNQYDGMLGGEQLPASLSPMWLEQTLRRGLAFDGVIISDDMEMGAIREHYGLRETVVRAVRAGSDILLFSNTANARPTLAQEVLDILVDEAEADTAFRGRIQQSYRRIVALKGRI